ncbi:hypothetical protein SAMN05216233_107220 [Desulfoluna spongiiphila]|uniref:Uncharacterized protein n=1 Tax=Desulfoluna spongiiphila TaxID=419481 RepID=A0A1G5F8M8_9BACT|nr:hypothetical protein SAMN05216233_107220 [Desulfoluna spongiiphila]
MVILNKLIISNDGFRIFIETINSIVVIFFKPVTCDNW